MFAAIIIPNLACATGVGSLLPNDFLQGDNAEVSAVPKNLRSCVIAAIKGVDGVFIDEAHYDARYEDVPLKTAMPNVLGEVQRRSGGRLNVFIGMLSEHYNPQVKDFAAPRVKAIAAGISRECGDRQ